MKKKLLLIALSSLLLSACSDRNQYEQAVLDQMRMEKDIQDYKLSPERMAKCVVDTTIGNMPGLFMFDPNRMAALRSYTKMINLTSSKDPKKTLEELRNEFGSAKALAEAHANFTESQMDCLSALIGESEDAAKNEK